MPGLVNAHLHADLCVLHALFSDLTATELMVETTDIYQNYPRDQYRELARAGYQLGTLNMIRSGITTFNAMDRDPRHVAEVVGDSGLRGVLGSIISDYVLPESLDEQLDRAEEVLDSLHGAYDGRIRTSVCPHGDLYCSKRTWRETARLASEYPEARIHTHGLETSHSNTMARAAGGDDAVSLFDQHDLLGDRLLVAHFLAGDEDDARRLAESGAHLLHCPTILTYYSVSKGAWPPMPTIQEAGGNVALGLDDPYWIDSWDLFREAKQGLCLERFQFGDGSATPHDFLQMVTQDGAEALGLGDEIGSIESGKRGDLVTIDVSNPKFHPVNHLPALLTNTATSGDVTNVVVDGRVLMRDRSVRTIDEKRVLRSASDALDQFLQTTGWRVSLTESDPPGGSATRRLASRKTGEWVARLAWQGLRDAFDLRA